MSPGCLWSIDHSMIHKFNRPSSSYSVVGGGYHCYLSLRVTQRDEFHPFLAYWGTY